MIFTLNVVIIINKKKNIMLFLKFLYKLRNLVNIFNQKFLYKIYLPEKMYDFIY